MQGDLLYKVLNWNLGNGSPAFLQQQQRAPYFLRFLPSESALWHDTFLVITSMPSSFKQQRNPWKTQTFLAVIASFFFFFHTLNSSATLGFYAGRELLFPTSNWWSDTNAQKLAQGRTWNPWLWRMQTSKSFHTGEHVEFELFPPLHQPCYVQDFKGDLLHPHPEELNYSRKCLPLRPLLSCHCGGQQWWTIMCLILGWMSRTYRGRSELTVPHGTWFDLFLCVADYS